MQALSGAAERPATITRWAPVVLIALIPIAIRLVFFSSYPGADDAFIHLAIINSLVETGTWGINPGDQVNLSTSPLFTAFFVGLSYLVGSPLKAGLALSMVAVFIALLMTYRIARHYLESHGSALVVLLIAATNVHLWRWTGTFMEVTFAYLAVLVNISVYLKLARCEIVGNGWRFFLQGAVLGLSVLLRPEIALLPIAFVLHDLLNRRSKAIAVYLAVGLGAAVVLIAYSLWSLSYFGAVLPSTFHAKTSSGLILVNLTITSQLAKVVGSAFVGLALLFVAALVSRRPTRGSQEPGILSYAVYLIFPLLGFLFFYFKTPYLQSPGRYFLPFMATIPLLSIPVLKSLDYRLFARSRNLAVAGALALQLSVSLYLNSTRIAPVLSRMWVEYVATMTEASEQVKSFCAVDESVLVYYDVGVVSWRLSGDRRIIDGGALASPELRGLTLDEMVVESDADFLLESLGNRGEQIRLDSSELELVWERSFLSHGVGTPDRTYYARLYRIVRPGTARERRPQQ